MLCLPKMPYAKSSDRRAFQRRRYRERLAGDAAKPPARVGDLLNCSYCETVFYRSPSNRLRRGFNQYCSRKCMADAFVGRSVGDKSPRWAGGWEPYYGSNWPNQKAEARSRDGYVCKRCGKSESELRRGLDVHHIRPFRLFGRIGYILANDLSNLVSLCKDCHRWAERISRFAYGWKKVPS